MNNKRKLAKLMLIPISIVIVILTFLYFQKHTIHKNIDLLKSKNPQTRKAAAKKLTQIGNPAVGSLIFVIKFDTDSFKSGVVNTIGTCLNNRNLKNKSVAILREKSRQRSEAARILGDIGNTKAIPPLAKLLKLNDPQVNESVTYSLKKFGELSTPYLIDMLRENSLQTRCSAAKILGEIGDCIAINPLVEILKTDKIEAKDAATEALVKMKKSATKPLLECLKNKDPKVRHRAADGLGRIGDVRAVESLCESVEDENIYVKLESIKALGEIGDLRGVVPIARCLNDKNKDIQAKARVCLKLIDKKYSMKGIIPKLFDKSTKTRVDALNKLTFFDLPGKNHIYVYKMEDPDNSVYYLALDKLRDERDPDIILPLVKLAVSSDIAHCRHDAVNLVERLIRFSNSDLKECNHKKINIDKPLKQKLISICKEGINYGHSEKRKAAVRILGYLKEKDTIDLLIKTIDDYNLDVKLEAIDALIKFEDDRVVEVLFDLMGDKNKYVRIRTFTINKIPGTKITQRLIKLIDDKNPVIRKTAIEILGQRGDEEAVNHLIRTLNDNDPIIRIYAISALKFLKDKSAVKPLVELAGKSTNSDELIEILKTMREIDLNQYISLAVQLIKDKNDRIWNTCFHYSMYPRSDESMVILKKLLGNNDLSEEKRELIIYETAYMSYLYYDLEKSLDTSNPLFRERIKQILNRVKQITENNNQRNRITDEQLRKLLESSP